MMHGNRSRSMLGALAAAALLTAADSARAAPMLRVAVDQEGDFTLIGNTLGHECRGSTPAPIVGTVGSCGDIQDTVHDSSPDIFWRADAPAAGQAEADASIAKLDARSAAFLRLPAGATVTHAFLYWGARNATGADTTVSLDREGGFSEIVTAIQSWEVTVNQGMPEESHHYQSVADVTAIVQENGEGAYRVGDVDVSDIVDVDDARTYVGWWMAVLYQAPGLPKRNLALFDGLDRVSQSNGQSFALDGLRVPEDGFEAKLGVVGYEGDNNLSGDRLFIRPSSESPRPDEAIGDAMNPIDNFFNGTRSALGAAVTVEGDLPQLAGTPQSMPGIDLDIVDITQRLAPGMTSVPVLATADAAGGEAELYFLGGWITSIGPAPNLYSTGSGIFYCAANPADRGGAASWLTAVAFVGLISLRRRCRARDASLT